MPDLKRIKRRTFHHEIENEDAPSGYVKLYNYKEPFMPFSGGFGYQGVLMFDGVSEKIQCHYCGVWSDYLPGHLKKEHNMTAGDYKEAVGLMKSTALISEKHREVLIANGLERRTKNLKSRKGTKVSKETKRKISKGLKDMNRERQNKLGTCPAQLIARLQNEFQRLGVTPVSNNALSKINSKHSRAKYSPEMIESSKRVGSEETYIRVFGSWKKALEMANIPYRKPGQNVTPRRSVWDELKAIEFFTSFIDANGREPKYRELPRALYGQIQTKRLDRKKIVAESWTKTRNTKGGSRIRYSKDQLLKFLRNFKEYHGRAPSYSDSRRRLIPHLSRYSYHFGSWKNALAQAFPR